MLSLQASRKARKTLTCSLGEIQGIQRCDFIPNSVSSSHHNVPSFAHSHCMLASITGYIYATKNMHTTRSLFAVYDFETTTRFKSIWIDFGNSWVHLSILLCYSTSEWSLDLKGYWSRSLLSQHCRAACSCSKPEQGRIRWIGIRELSPSQRLPRPRYWYAQTWPALWGRTICLFTNMASFFECWKKFGVSRFSCYSRRSRQHNVSSRVYVEMVQESPLNVWWTETRAPRESSTLPNKSPESLFYAPRRIERRMPLESVDLSLYQDTGRIIEPNQTQHLAWYLRM